MKDHTPLWTKYGLTIQNTRYPKTQEELQRIMDSHDTVARFLEAHPNIAARYNANGTEYVGYFDVLRMARSQPSR